MFVVAPLIMEFFVNFDKMLGVVYNPLFRVADTVASDYGGGIVCVDGGTIINTIIYENQATASNNNWQVSGSGVSLSYCCTFPIAGIPGGNGCITNNPEFVVPGSDYHLQELSPCRNSGSNMLWMTSATDLDGNPRITGDTVDMGCYEYIPEPGLFIIYYLLFIIYLFF